MGTFEEFKERLEQTPEEPRPYAQLFEVEVEGVSPRDQYIDPLYAEVVVGKINDFLKTVSGEEYDIAVEEIYEELSRRLIAKHDSEIEGIAMGNFFEALLKTQKKG